MMVKDLLALFSERKPDEEIYILWFDKEEAELRLDQRLSKKEWADVVESMRTCEDIEEIAMNAMHEAAEC